MSQGGPVVEHFFRREAGRLTATLVRCLGPGRLALAEEIVQDTLLVALERWKYGDLPANPAAWLTRTARNRALDALRRHGTREKYRAQLEQALRSAAPGPPDASFRAEVRDDLLRLAFSCCVPGLWPGAQVALVLKTLCGFSVREIACALLASPAAIERRISRAKRALRAHGLVDVTGEALAARLPIVQQVVYLMFSEGYHGSSGGAVREDLCGEAMRLAHLLAHHPATAHPTSDALMALVCLHGARLRGRVGPDGELVALRHQDRARWNHRLVRVGMAHLARSARGHELSRLHLEAALAAVHAAAPSWEATDWGRIVAIYDVLLHVAPSPIVHLNRAIALGWRDGPSAGLRALGGGPAAELEPYPFLHAARGEILLRLDELDAAQRAFRAALQRARNDDEAAFLRERLAQVLP